MSTNAGESLPSDLGVFWVIPVREQDPSNPLYEFGYIYTYDVQDDDQTYINADFVKGIATSDLSDLAIGDTVQILTD